MLSRIAGSLFWIGRYLERAENISRILEVKLQQFTEDPTVDEQAASASLLGAMGLELGEHTDELIDGSAVMRYLWYDPDSDSSVRAMIAAMRQSARRIRETISPELWEAINTTFNEIFSSSFTAIRPIASLQLVRLRCVQIAGLASQTMVHDEAYHFFSLGQSLERVDMTSRLISTVAVEGNNLVAWTRALRAVGGYHAFTRTYFGEGDYLDATRFLIVDRRFPHSLVYGLQAVQDSLGELDPINVKARQDPTARLVGRTRSRMEYLDTPELIQGLTARMEQVQIACAQVSAELTQRYFASTEASIWHWEVMACD